MAAKIESTKQGVSPQSGNGVATVDQATPGNAGHAAHKSHFLRHLLEMTLAMMVGMVVGGAVFTGILATMGMTVDASRFPELFLLVMGFNMSVPMVA